MTPLNWPSPDLVQHLPVRLGFGFEVRDVSDHLARIDLDVWRRFISEDRLARVKKWTVCLVGEYREGIRSSNRQQFMEALLHYVVAHLRLIVPNAMHADRFLRIEIDDEQTRAQAITDDISLLFLEDCEEMCSEIHLEHIEKLRSWMRWIVRFKFQHQKFYPLYLSLYFAELARAQRDMRVRHVLRVMALEALVSTGTIYGLNALSPKMTKLLGRQTDLYSPYRNTNQASIPPLALSNVIRDVCALRNKIAHGDTVPPQWLTPNCRHTYNSAGQLGYSQELLEAATSMLSLAWRKILDNRLQAVFSSKAAMENYFKRAKSIP